MVGFWMRFGLYDCYRGDIIVLMNELVRVGKVLWSLGIVLGLSCVW